MYQARVKQLLVMHKFLPREGWTVTVDVDGMERRGEPAKVRAATEALAWFQANGVSVTRGGAGKRDIVAHHPVHGTFVVEAEGVAKRQPEQRIYSALGQALCGMTDETATYVIAVPQVDRLDCHARRVPEEVRRKLNLRCWIVSDAGVEDA